MVLGWYRRGQHGGGNGVVTDDTHHLFHQVFLDGDVVAPVRNIGLQAGGIHSAYLESQRLQDLLHLLYADIHAQDLLEPPGAHPHCLTGHGLIGEFVHDALSNLSAGHLLDQLGRAPECDGSQFRSQTLLKPQGRFGPEAQVLSGLPVVIAIEGGRLQKHRHRVRPDFAVGAADDPGEADGVMSVCDHQYLGAKPAFHSVQRDQFFVGFSPAHDDGPVLKLVVIKGVEGLVELQHNVVGYVHHVVDGPISCFGQPVLQPLGRRANLQPLDQAGGVAVAQIRVGHGYGYLAGYGWAVFRVRDHGLCDLFAGEGPHLVGHAQDG